MFSSGPPPEPMTTTSMACWDIEGEERRKAEGVCGEERGGRGLSFRKGGQRCEFYSRAGIEFRVASWFKGRVNLTDVFAVLEQ